MFICCIVLEFVSSIIERKFIVFDDEKFLIWFDLIGDIVILVMC